MYGGEVDDQAKKEQPLDLFTRRGERPRSGRAEGEYAGVSALQYAISSAQRAERQPECWGRWMKKDVAVFFIAGKAKTGCRRNEYSNMIGAART